jgi:hypothetical protein
MKQTAVEWLFLMINNPNKDQKFANKLLDKAKEMEKQQIIDAYEEGKDYGFKDNGEQYYNQTF